MGRSPRRLQQELPATGLCSPHPEREPLADRDLRGEGPGRTTARRLAGAKVEVKLAQHYMRISPSIYNDAEDVERLLDALS